MSYVDGFVIPVPKSKKGEYLEMAAAFAPIFKEFGALRVVECWGDDIPKGKQTDFFMSVRAEETETVVFSWIVWPSKEARDQGTKKMMEDERMKNHPECPFDARRMITGGFEVLLDTGD